MSLICAKRHVHDEGDDDMEIIIYRVGEGKSLCPSLGGHDSLLQNCALKAGVQMAPESVVAPFQLLIYFLTKISETVFELKLKE